MKQPTHFIEVWKSGSDGNIYNSPIGDIKDLLLSLSLTDYLRGTTIAVWKIYPKNEKETTDRPD